MAKYRTVEAGYIYWVNVQRKFWFGWLKVGFVRRGDADDFVRKLQNPIIKEYP